MTPHTPGPWRGGVGDHGGWWGIGPDGASLLIGDRRSEEEIRANARLIAAAPELLAALKTLTHEIFWITDQTDEGRLAAIERLHKDGRAIEGARIAIAKATGEE